MQSINWFTGWFDEEGNYRKQKKEPCPWCGEVDECTPMCRSKYPNGVKPEDEHSQDYCKPEDETHDCIDHLQVHQHEWTEPHGERCYQEWWECSLCGEEFTGRETK